MHLEGATGRLRESPVVVGILCVLALVQIPLLSEGVLEGGISGLLVSASGFYAVGAVLVAVLGGWHRSAGFAVVFSGGLSVLLSVEFVVSGGPEHAVFAALFGLCAIYYGRHWVEN